MPKPKLKKTKNSILVKISGKSFSYIVKLFVPENYYFATHKQRAKIANGCGTSGWKGILVPDKIIGIPITEACNIHDWQYEYGKNIEDKKSADRTFLNNMVRIIRGKKSWKWVTKIRLWRCNRYYDGVKYFGGPAFWANKN